MYRTRRVIIDLSKRDRESEMAAFMRPILRFEQSPANYIYVYILRLSQCMLQFRSKRPLRGGPVWHGKWHGGGKWFEYLLSNVEHDEPDKEYKRSMG